MIDNFCLITPYFIDTKMYTFQLYQVLVHNIHNIYSEIKLISYIKLYSFEVI